MSEQTEVKLVLGGIKGEVWVDGKDLAGVVGTIEMVSEPGQGVCFIMNVVPQHTIVEAQGEVEFKCVACGQAVDRPDPPEQR